MGYGSYTSADWSKLKESSKISESSTADQIFKSQEMEERFNPKFINMRDSLDSEEHPNSTPIIIGLDVTGSMGYLSAQIAKEGLNETMMKIYSTKPVADPQMMFAALGDVQDDAPLQVTHFESDIRIAEQLLALWLEGCGGDFDEDYQLLWYFAAKHTHIDAYDKRGQKGFIFTIGDADCHQTTSASDIKAIFSDKVKNDYSLQELAQMASEKYELIHIAIDGIQDNLNKALPGRNLPIAKDNIDALPELLISTMRVLKGEDREKVIASCSELAQPVIRRAFKELIIADKSGKEIVF